MTLYNAESISMIFPRKAPPPLLYKCDMSIFATLKPLKDKIFCVVTYENSAILRMIGSKNTKRMAN